jgi:hypothetical protein
MNVLYQSAPTVQKVYDETITTTATITKAQLDVVAIHYLEFVDILRTETADTYKMTLA